MPTEAATEATPMRVSISTANGPLTSITAERKPEQTTLGFLAEIVHGLHESVESMKADGTGQPLLGNLYRPPLTVTVEEE